MKNNPAKGREQDRERDRARDGDGADNPDASENAIELLLRQHREVDALFERFEECESGSPESMIIAQDIAFALNVHARIEEEIFYPAAREALGDDGKDLLDEAAVGLGELFSLLHRSLQRLGLGRLRGLKLAERMLLGLLASLLLGERFLEFFLRIQLRQRECQAPLVGKKDRKEQNARRGTGSDA